VAAFLEDTAAVRVAGDEYAVTISRDWWVFTGANGGYIASVLLRALTARLDDPARAVRSLTVHYLRPPAEGPAVVRTRLVRSGRSLATLTGTLEQDGNPVALATAAFSVARPFLTFTDLPMPGVPGPEGSPPSAWPEEMLPPIARRFAYRPVGGEAVFAGLDRASVAAWIRPREDVPYDAVLLATVADALVPAVFPKVTAPVVATTIDLTVHFRAPMDEPLASGWAYAAFRSTVGVDGFVEEDGEVWSESGRLLVQSRQLALVRPVS
jgi:acyl-CoA thioesterase